MSPTTIAEWERDIRMSRFEARKTPVVDHATKVLTTVLVKPVRMGRLTRWKVSCNECNLRSIPIAQKDMAEQIAFQHARDQHLGSARVAVRQR